VRLEQLKAVFAKVAVEGEGLHDRLLAHHDEAGSIDETECFATRAEHVGLGGGELRFGDVVEVDEWKQLTVEPTDIGKAEAGLNE